MVDGLKVEMAATFNEALRSDLERFIATQRKVFLALADQSHVDLTNIRQRQADTYETERSALNEAQSILVDFCSSQPGRS